ncbi:putative glutamine amidotransferase [subsurface metagenome]
MKRIGLSLCIRYEHELQDCLNHSYVHYLDRFGVVPVLIPNTLDEPQEYVDSLSLDGLLLTGGSDTIKSVDGVSTEHVSLRDRTERALTTWACKRRIPVMGICRGFHFLNVYFGGKIVFDIHTKGIIHETHVGRNHNIILVHEGIRQMLNTNSIIVNSYHNNGITFDSLALPFVAFAEVDGLVEGAVHTKLPVCGIQWHPERPCPSSEINDRLFENFLAGTLWRTQ